MHQVGKYEILSEIGRGAMGAVYKARDPLIGRLVALKTITSGVSAQASSLERFYQEARSAGALQHPNIVTIYELGHEDNTPFIAMEYIEGGSLDKLIEQRQALPLSIKLGYTVRVCDALSYAHGHNVIHRDIKPANIMVTREGVVKVVDFGIARLTDVSLTQANMMIGSRAYMSPQLYKGERADPRADIWAVGITLYELLAYRRPFGGDSEAELMFHILSDPPSPLQSLVPDCPEELAAIVARMLEKKPQDRYQSMEDVLHDLEPLWKSAQQAALAGLLSDCQQLIVAKDLHKAQGLLRKALQIDIANTQAKSLLEKVTTELRRNQILPKINEHLERARIFLQKGQLHEARSEADAALGLDSRHEPAKQLLAELETAAARTQEVEQKLRLTKQRLAEGALTEAAAALGAALELDGANSQARELRRQIDDERNRREKRKKLSEVLHQARTLWTALNYEECLSVLAAALKEFQNEPELIKLQEMARHDLEDLQKQRQMGEIRKLLGQQKFGEARKIADDFARKYPQDTALKNLQTLALEGELEEKKSKRYVDELAALRVLLSGGKFGAAVAKGEALLREYPEEFELKELVAYARGEITQQEQRQREKETRDLIERENYREAEALARTAAREFPKQEIFRKLAEEAGEKRQAQEKRERTRQDMQHRIDEIRGKLNQEKISDAIMLAQQTLVHFGPDPNVTKLLNDANAKQEERRKKEEQERQFVAADTMADAGDFIGATQVLQQAMATQIFERSDPRVLKRLREIEQISPASGPPLATGKQNAEPKEAGIRLDRNKSVERPDTAEPSQQPIFSESAVLKPATGKQEKTRAGWKYVVRDHFAKALARMQGQWQALTPHILPALKKPAVLGTAGAVAILSVVIVVLANRGPSKKERELREQALTQWASHELDQSEQTWKQIQVLHGGFQKEAEQRLKEIQSKRQQESQLLGQGESVLNEEKEYASAAQTFRDVIQMNLWLTDKARSDLALAEAGGEKLDAGKQEQQHFDLGKGAFDRKAFDEARKEFQAALDLNVPNSTLRPEIMRYLKRITLSADAKKLYEQAQADIKNEKWEAAQQQLQEIVDRKGALSGEAKQRLSEVAAASKAEESFHRTLQDGAYRDAKSQLDGMQWPKTKERLWSELRDKENRQETDIRIRANKLNENGDLDGLVRLQEEFRNFAGRVEDPTLTKWASAKGDFDTWLTNAVERLRQQQGDKAEFEAAVKDFNAAKEKEDVSHMQKEVKQRFQKIAKGGGAFRGEAQEYVEKTIPATVEELISKKVGPGKIVVPPISCNGETPSGSPKPGLQTVSCSELDADAPLLWIGTPTMDSPWAANQPGKPTTYTLHVTMTVDSAGKVKIEKAGEVDNDFFKKAKDAAKHWKATIPKKDGKPVSVTFPFSIPFHP